AVLGWKRDASERHLDAAALQAFDHRGDVLLHHGDGQATQTVVSSEFQDNDLRLVREHAVDAFEAVLGCVTADALVDNPVAIARGVEQALQVGWIARRWFNSKAGGETVAEADDHRPG